MLMAVWQWPLEDRHHEVGGFWIFKDHVMIHRAFTMKLFPGFEEEYKKRHQNLWPDLKDLLKKSGVREYYIYLDERSLTLFGVMQVEDPALLEGLPDHPVMKKWWAYMKDIMDTNPDNSPVSAPLTEVFYLP